jgi:hypothetical protein
MRRPMTAPTLELDHLVKVRLVIARFGEMDRAKWWNTKGQLGRMSAFALRRGFPRRYCFAQARAVFAFASARCAEVFDPPGCVTLFRLPVVFADLGAGVLDSAMVETAAYCLEVVN